MIINKKHYEIMGFKETLYTVCVLNCVSVAVRI